MSLYCNPPLPATLHGLNFITGPLGSSVGLFYRNLGPDSGKSQLAHLHLNHLKISFFKCKALRYSVEETYQRSIVIRVKTTPITGGFTVILPDFSIVQP